MARLPWPPPPPPPRGNHQQLATPPVSIVGAADVPPNAINCHPLRQHQPPPDQHVIIQGMLRDEAIEFTLPMKPPRGAPLSPQAMNISLDQIMRQSRGAPTSPQGTDRSTDGIMNQSRAPPPSPQAMARSMKEIMILLGATSSLPHMNQSMGDI